MKKTLIVLVVIAAISLTSWQLVPSLHSGQVQSQHPTEPVDESQIIVAQFDWGGKQHQISLAELKSAIAELPIYRQQNYESKAGRAEYLEEFIGEKLKQLAAIEKGFDKNEELLKKAEDYKHQLMVEKLTELEVDQKIIYTDDDLKQYYDAHKGEYVEDAQVRATCIALTDEDLAQETLKEIQSGVDMIEMAKELSAKGELTGPGSNKNDPGNTGFFPRAASARWQSFIDAVFAQEIGEMTQEVFEIDVNDQTYYLLFRKEEDQPERQQTFEEVKDKIERAVEREKKRSRITEWVQEISTQAQLKTYPDRIPAPPPEAENKPDESK